MATTMSLSCLYAEGKIMAEQNWVIQTKKADFNLLAEKFNIDPVTARILINRDLEEDEFEKFLNPNLNNMYDPFLMEDMNHAVRIIIHDIEEGNLIRIVSDYDADGVMSNYILYKGLKKIGARVDYVIPHRVKDGYGISEEIILKAAEDNVHTILTCDNGIAANTALSKAKELGLTVVVTDHHQVPFIMEEEKKHYILPPADAILNPKKASCKYPYKDLCGAGVAYKLIEALYTKREIPKNELYKFIEFVAIATICDVVSLTDENRIFVTKGLESINHTDNKGLRALISANELSDVKIDAHHVSFVLGPCINAAGRLETAYEAMELLVEENTENAINKAQNILAINAERKAMTEKGVEDAVEYLRRFGDSKVYVVYLPDCHESLAGIIAGRIRENYNHPVLVIVNGEKQGILKGSGRSIEGYDMFEALQKCNDLLVKFGGHEMAAGFSLEEDKLDEFISRLNETCELNEESFIPKIKIDVPMPISYVTENLIEEFGRLAPFGKGNEKPVFAQKDVNILSAKILGKNRNVVKLTLEGIDEGVCEGIYFDGDEFTENIINWFGQNEYDKMMHGWLNNIRLNIVYYPVINEFRGTKTIQIQIKRYAMAAVREVL